MSLVDKPVAQSNSLTSSLMYIRLNPSSLPSAAGNSEVSDISAKYDRPSILAFLFYFIKKLKQLNKIGIFSLCPQVHLRTTIDINSKNTDLSRISHD